MINYSQAFSDSGLDFVFRLDDSLLWEKTYNKLDYRQVSYLASSLEYQLAYSRGHGGEWTDLSCILFLNNEAVAIWPLTICSNKENFSLTSQGQSVMPPQFISGISERNRKKITLGCLRVVDNLAQKLNISEWCSNVINPNKLTIENWQTILMENGSHCKVRYELYVDLQLTNTEIKSKIRRRYRSLINYGERLWSIDLLFSPGDLSLWEEFRKFHAMVAGRTTRSLESWQLQYQALVNDEAFLVILRDIDGQMTGAGFFMCSEDEGVYAVGAYDRQLFERPLGHVVQYRAIEELKKRGCKWYRIGTRPYLTDVPTPSEKELSIGYFKEGFASHIFPSFDLVRKY